MEAELVEKVNTGGQDNCDFGLRLEPTLHRDSVGQDPMSWKEKRASGNPGLSIEEANEKEVVTGSPCSAKCHQHYHIVDAIANLLPLELRE